MFPERYAACYKATIYNKAIRSGWSMFVALRKGGEYILARPETIDFVDVSPKQIVSVAAALIPFLENDDANRALMGSIMQRQAVPLVRAEAPFVGTGMEGTVARDSGAAIAARRGGVIDQVDATRIVARHIRPVLGEVRAGAEVRRAVRVRGLVRGDPRVCRRQGVGRGDPEAQEDPDESTRADARARPRQAHRRG